MNPHIEELAELYALGSLDEIERARVDRHAALCRACAKRLDDAAAAVAVIAQSEELHQPPDRLRERLERSIAPPARPAPRAHLWHSALAGVAAALVLALIPVWLAVDRNVVASQDERALARIASSPFERADFMPRAAARRMAAKVLYAPDGSWYYVVIMHPKRDMRIAYEHAGRMEMLGTVAMHGESGTLYLPVNHRMEELALLEGGRVVADARLAY